MTALNLIFHSDPFVQNDHVKEMHQLYLQNYLRALLQYFLRKSKLQRMPLPIRTFDRSIIHIFGLVIQASTFYVRDDVMIKDIQKHLVEIWWTFPQVGHER